MKVVVGEVYFVVESSCIGYCVSCSSCYKMVVYMDIYRPIDYSRNS